jgi:hypothetical protein
MNLKRLALTTLLLAFAAFPIPTIYARKHAESGIVRTTKFPFHGILKSVDVLAQTFTLTGKSARVFAVTPETRITKTGSHATLADAPIGEQVTGYAIKSPDGQLTAQTLFIGPHADPQESPSPQ